jgi:thioredoxin 1
MSSSRSQNKKKHAADVPSFVTEVTSNEQLRRFLLENSQNRLATVIKFGADWCGPCRNIEPVFEQLASASMPFARFYKVDVDVLDEVAGQMNVKSLPIFVFLRVEGDTMIDLVPPVVGASKSDLERALQAVRNLPTA